MFQKLTISKGASLNYEKETISTFKIWSLNTQHLQLFNNLKWKYDSINSRKRKQLDYNQSYSIGLIGSHNLLSVLFPFTFIPISNIKIQVRIALVATKPRR